MTALTCIDRTTTSWIQKALAIATGTLLLTLASQITIFLPFTPVPIAFTPSLALCLGIVLGPYEGTIAVLLYLLEGVCGLPVFSGGRSGLWMLMGPTGGYLIGYALGAFVSGWVMKRWFRSRGGVLAAMFAGAVPLYLCGVTMLAPYVGWPQVFMAGVLPFLPGCLLKSVALTWALPQKVIGHAGSVLNKERGSCVRG